MNTYYQGLQQSNLLYSSYGRELVNGQTDRQKERQRPRETTESTEKETERRGGGGVMGSSPRLLEIEVWRAVSSTFS